MASKRALKKEVVKLVAMLYDEAYLLRSLSVGDTVDKLDDFMDDLLVFTDDTLRRIQHPDGKDNAKLVKAYYRTLRRDIKEKIDLLDDRFAALLSLN